MTRQLFDEMVGTAPPSTVDVHAIVRRETRKSARRWTGVLTAAVAAVAISAGVVATVDRGPDGVRSAVDPPPGAVDNGFRLTATDRESTEATAARLREAIDGAVRRAAPGARWIATGAYENAAPDGQPPNLSGPGSTAEVDRMFNGGTGILAEGRKGTLSISVIQVDRGTITCDPSDAKCVAERALPDRTAEKRAQLLTCRGEAGCTESTGPKGETIVALSSAVRLKQFPGPLLATSHTVRIELADRRVLVIDSRNDFAPPGGKNALQQPDPPLTAAQVVAIGSELAGKIKA